MSSKIDKDVVSTVCDGAISVFSEKIRRPAKCCTCKKLKICRKCNSINRLKGNCGHWYCNKCSTSKLSIFGYCPCRHDNNEEKSEEHYLKHGNEPIELEDICAIFEELIEKIKKEISEKKDKKE